MRAWKSAGPLQAMPGEPRGAVSNPGCVTVRGRAKKSQNPHPKSRKKRRPKITQKSSKKSQKGTRQLHERHTKVTNKSHESHTKGTRKSQKRHTKVTMPSFAVLKPGGVLRGHRVSDAKRWQAAVADRRGGCLQSSINPGARLRIRKINNMC